MSVQLRIRLLLAVLLGALLIVSFGTALQFREIANSATAQLGPGAEQLADRSTTAAAGLALFGVLALVLGAGATRSLQRSFLRPLQALERAALDVSTGDSARRVPALGKDELTRIANALNHVLDERDRSVAELDGRNRDMRALLVSLLRAWPRPAAVASIDGDILASTLDESDEQHVRTISPQVRKAAGILLSRGFASASDLSTDVSFVDGTIVHVRALALADQRFVGWLAECVHRPETATVPESERGLELGQES